MGRASAFSTRSLSSCACMSAIASAGMSASRAAATAASAVATCDMRAGGRAGDSGGQSTSTRVDCSGVRSGRGPLRALPAVDAGLLSGMAQPSGPRISSWEPSKGLMHPRQVPRSIQFRLPHAAQRHSGRQPPGRQGPRAKRPASRAIRREWLAARAASMS